MNEFERKLSQQTFRPPPPELREAIFGASSPAIVPGPWTWRDWFWPSPHAWAALAALWMIFAVLPFGDHPLSPTALQPPEPAPSVQATPTLLTFHNAREFRHVLDLAH